MGFENKQNKEEGRAMRPVWIKRAVLAGEAVNRYNRYQLNWMRDAVVRTHQNSGGWIIYMYLTENIQSNRKNR